MLVSLAGQPHGRRVMTRWLTTVVLSLSLLVACGSEDAPVAPGAGGQGGMGLPDGPEPESVDFVPLASVPAGEQILFNDWSFPDRVLSMRPDGSDATPILSLYRVWSMGVSRAGDRLAIAIGDPLQEENYGITIGDSIQHTWIYDMASQDLYPVAVGNINDECHHFGPSDEWLYVCRRYDFTSEGGFSGYRIGRLALGSLDFEWLLPDDDSFTLIPQVRDGDMIFTRIVLAGGSQTGTLERLPFDGTPELLLADATRAVLSPDGGRMVYSDSNQQGALVVADSTGQNPILVADERGTAPSWSPDGSRIAYLSPDASQPCSHVHVVAVDGSQATTPTRIRDCVETGENITQLEWFVRP